MTTLTQDVTTEDFEYLHHDDKPPVWDRRHSIRWPPSSTNTCRRPTGSTPLPLPSELAADRGHGVELGVVVAGKTDDEVAGPGLGE